MKLGGRQIRSVASSTPVVCVWVSVESEVADEAMLCAANEGLVGYWDCEAAHSHVEALRGPNDGSSKDPSNRFISRNQGGSPRPGGAHTITSSPEAPLYEYN